MRLEEVRDFWTKVLGTHGTQWMIVAALRELDQGEGATVQAIADLLQVNPGFVASHSRFLQGKGLVRATVADEDGAAMMLSLTDQARRHFTELALLQKR
jgi:DNA-binding MarR family transcriptional regulator